MPGPAVIMLPSQGQDVAAFRKTARALKRRVYKGNATIVETRVWLENTFRPGDGDESQGHEPRWIIYTTDKGRRFHPEDMKDISTFMWMSHSGLWDGPNIDYGSTCKGASNYQPWSRMEAERPERPEKETPFAKVDNKFIKPNLPLYGGVGRERQVGDPDFPVVFNEIRPFRLDMLREEASKFWSTVGQGLQPDGKIILLGCKMGAPGINGDANKLLMAYAQHVANTSSRPTYAATGFFAAASPRVSTKHVKSIEATGDVFRAPPGRGYGVMKSFAPTRR